MKSGGIFEGGIFKDIGEGFLTVVTLGKYYEWDQQDLMHQEAEDSQDKQNELQKQNLIRQGYQNSKNQIAAGHLQKTQATKTKMQAGSAVKINEFANKRAELKTAMHHDKIRENLHLRASRPTGNPHITRRLA